MRTAARIFNIIGFKHAAKLAHGCGIAIKQFCLSPKMQRCIAGKGFFYENIMRAAHNYCIYCFTFKERKMLFEYIIKSIGGKTAALYPLYQPGARDADNAGRVLHCGKQMLIAREGLPWQRLKA